MTGYTLSQFNKDMSQLGGMIDNFYNSNGGANNMSGDNSDNMSGNMSDDNMSGNMYDDNMLGGKNDNKLKSNIKNKSSKNKSPKDKSPKDKTPKNKSPKNKLVIDVSMNRPIIRRFKVITVDGNPYPFYRPYKGAEPKDAAKKAGKRICDKLYDNKGKNCKLASFELKETTRGSQKRVYGPYIGEFEKLATPRKLKFKGKPEFVQTHRFVVKLKK